MIEPYLQEVGEITKHLDRKQIFKAYDILKSLKGRLFILGVGGSAANASHAVNDFRKIAGLEAYAPTDNVAELTAITNDLDWDEVFVHWLVESKLNKNDVVMVLSVGGGTDIASKNLVYALKLAEEVKCRIIGIVGPEGGYTAEVANVCIKIPTSKDFKTPLTESFQAVVWHLLALMLS